VTADIGTWFRRPDGKWHLVESRVEDRAITRCGRDMDIIHQPTEFSDVQPLTRMIDQPQLCHGGCS